MIKNYYIGLDLGSDSVGWAVTDENYNLLKVRGKDFWGSYLFEEAQTAMATRLARLIRRRGARVRVRIKLLQELFAEEICKVDPTFFIRLENSKYFPEDKADAAKGKYLLFNDVDFNDKDYYKKYPTIFHLRRALIEEDIKDVRLLYLAVHHIVKNRGHFLFEDQDFSATDTKTVVEDFARINSFMSQNEAPTFPVETIDDIFNVLCNRDFGKTAKAKQISLLVSAPKNKQLASAIKGLSGGIFNLSDLFSADDDLGEITKLSFDDKNFEESFAKATQEMDDEQIGLIASMKRIYDLSILQDILHGNEYISIAKTDSYECHKKDLAELKNYVRNNCPEMYEMAFRRVDGVNNYAAYVGKDKNKGFKKCTKEDFYSFVKRSLNVQDERILKAIDDGTFMPKQISGENCVIPYQVHLAELKAILKKAERNFDFLKVVSDEMSVSDKIISLMTFRVPYYVGPLTDVKTKHSWMIKREGYRTTSITPWNFNKVVDVDATEQEFIRRMTNKCTYLVGEDVLPASSLLYSEFVFRNELNNLKINGEKNARVNEILYALAQTTRKMTAKKCCDKLIKEGLLPKNSKANEVFSGIDGDFKASLSSYIDFKNIITDKVDLYPDMCEQIILWITLISDKNRLSNLIKKEYGKLLTDDEIKAIKGLNYSKWGSLSRKLLTEIYEIDENGEIGDVSIIEKLRDSNENFMQLLSLSYGYSRAIEVENRGMADEKGVTYRTIEELYCSPLVKRPIWSAVKIVREIVKAMGCAPKKIFVEVVRKQVTDKNKKGRTVSRKQALLALYNNIGAEARVWIDQIEKLDDNVFNSDKVYFYYTQMGTDAYTRKPIPFDKLFDVGLYDIDHIYPQSKIKDDSLNNRVLSSKHFNQFVKKDTYPLPAETQSLMRPYWGMLKDQGLISDEKYYRLTRTTPLTQAECSDFINRQLVATGQSTKAAATVLKKMFGENTEIVYSKASNAAEFKDRIKLVKVRELNDLHHAKDAYINIVCGNVFNTKFNHNATAYFRNHEMDSYNLSKLYDSDIAGAWKVGDENRIRSIAERNTCRVVRFNAKGSGALFEATIKPAGSSENLVPLKGKGPLTNTAKYGGYEGIATAYFMLVACLNKRNNRSLMLIPMSIYSDKQIKSDEDRIEYCKSRYKLNAQEILIPCIKKNSLININGSYAWVRGCTGNRISLCNAIQLHLEEDQTKQLKLITNYLRDVKKYRNSNLKASEKITKENNLILYETFVQKLSLPIYSGLSSLVSPRNDLINMKENFTALEKEKQCIVLMEILKLLQCNTMTSDFSLIGGKRTVGTILTNIDVTDKNMKLLMTSPTGYYVETIDFNKFL